MNFNNLDKYVATLKEIELEYEREVNVLEKSLDNNYSHQLQKNKQKPPSNDDKVGITFVQGLCTTLDF